MIVETPVALIVPLGFFFFLLIFPNKSYFNQAEGKTWSECHVVTLLTDAKLSDRNRAQTQNLKPSHWQKLKIVGSRFAKGITPTARIPQNSSKDGLVIPQFRISFFESQHRFKKVKRVNYIFLKSCREMIIFSILNCGG